MIYEAYTDGSYKEVTKADGTLLRVYGSAAVFAPQGSNKWQSLSVAGSDPKYISSRNITGECFAVMQLLNYLITKDIDGKPIDIDKLILYYDYRGVEDWVTGAWKPSKPIAQLYYRYMSTIGTSKFPIDFRHVKGHSGNAGNELVDKIARNAVEEAIAKET